MTVNPFLPSALNDLFRQVSREGRFQMMVLSDAEGLPFANSGVLTPEEPPCSEETLAALSSLISVFKQRVEKEIASAETDEISIVLKDKSRLVCRYFDAGSANFILSFLVKPQKSYRRQTNSIIRRIKNFYKTGR